MNIQIQNLQLRWSDFSLNIPKWQLPFGQHILIEGPSGSGKTSFLHCLAGLLPIPMGSVKIGDHELAKLSGDELSSFRKSHCGIVFQKIHLLPHLTLMENVRLAAGSASDDQIAAILKSLNLGGRLEHLPRQLSQGETQRAAVARAVISNPSLILADEPTSGLDDDNAKRVMTLLLKKAEGKTLIVVSHDHRAREFFKTAQNFTEILKQ